MQLPPEVEQGFKQASASGEPTLSARALSSLEGELGETYLLADAAALYLFSRKVGEEYRQHQFDLATIESLELSEDRPFAYLHLSVGGRRYSLKFSAMDLDGLQGFVALKGAAPTTPGESAPAAPMPAAGEEVELTPVIGFCATVYAMIQADGNIDSEELRLLNRQVEDAGAIDQGLEYLRRHGPVELLEELRAMLDRRQKLCLIANLIEMSMVDGLLRTTEQQLLKQVREALAIGQNDYEALYEALMIKNNTAVFPGA